MTALPTRRSLRWPEHWAGRLLGLNLRTPPEPRKGIRCSVPTIPGVPMLPDAWLCGLGVAVGAVGSIGLMTGLLVLSARELWD